MPQGQCDRGSHFGVRAQGRGIAFLCENLGVFPRFKDLNQPPISLSLQFYTHLIRFLCHHCHESILQPKCRPLLPAHGCGRFAMQPPLHNGDSCERVFSVLQRLSRLRNISPNQYGRVAWHAGKTRCHSAPHSWRWRRSPSSTGDSTWTKYLHSITRRVNF